MSRSYLCAPLYTPIARLLVQRWMRAKGLQDVASYTYTHLISLVQGNVLLHTTTLCLSLAMHVTVLVTEDVVKKWIEDEKAVICTKGTSKCNAALFTHVT